MPKPNPRIVTSNSTPLIDVDEHPQCMFYRFALTAELDIGGINGAREFFRRFIGWHRWNPFFYVWKARESIARSREAMVDLIVKHGEHYSCEEAGDLINRAINQTICYATRKKIKKTIIGGQVYWMKVEEKRSFILRKIEGRDYYYLVLK